MQGEKLDKEKQEFHTPNKEVGKLKVQMEDWTLKHAYSLAQYFMVDNMRKISLYLRKHTFKDLAKIQSHIQFVVSLYNMYL